MNFVCFSSQYLECLGLSVLHYWRVQWLWLCWACSSFSVPLSQVNLNGWSVDITHTQRDKPGITSVITSENDTLQGWFDWRQGSTLLQNVWWPLWLPSLKWNGPFRKDWSPAFGMNTVCCLVEFVGMHSYDVLSLLKAQNAKFEKPHTFYIIASLQGGAAIYQKFISPL